MAVQSSVTYVKIGSTMVAKPVSVRVSGAWHPVQSVPNAPTGVTAVAGNTTADLDWTAPAFSGGAPITSYTVTRSPGNVTSSVSGTSATVTGLTNGTVYTFTVTATNAVGTGAASSASNGVIPSATITGKMYITPASGTYHVGDSISITVNEDSLTTAIKTVEVDLTYPAGILQYVSATVNSSVFTSTFQNTGGSGSVAISTANFTTTQTGDQLVATINFTVLATGSPTITVANSAAIYRASDTDPVNILNSRTNASYTVT